MTKARIERQAAVLLAADLPAAIAYWRDRLGFDAHGIFGDPPYFAIMERDSSFVMLKQAPAGYNIVPLWEVSENLWNAYFWVDDVQTLYDEMRARGASIDYALCDQPYGVREFGVQDLDRHDIGFGQVMAAGT